MQRGAMDEQAVQPSTAMRNEGQYFVPVEHARRARSRVPSDTTLA
jgi:hypothetical protein